MTTVSTVLKKGGLVDVSRDDLTKWLTRTVVTMPAALPSLADLLMAHAEIWGGQLLVRPEPRSVDLHALYVRPSQRQLFWTMAPYCGNGHQSFWQFMWVEDLTQGSLRQRVIRIWWE